MIEIVRELFVALGITGQTEILLTIAVLVLIGIVGIVFQTLVSWRRDVSLANRQKDIEANLKVVQIRLDVRSHVTRAQWDAEFDIYRKLWKRIFELKVVLGEYIVTFDDVLDGSRSVIEQSYRHADCLKALNTYTKVMDENSPFYPEEVLNAALALRKNALETINLFVEHYNDSMEHLKDCRAANEKTKSQIKNLSEIIKLRLASVAILD